jgi:hypothetical protein
MCIGAAMHVTHDVDDVTRTPESTSQTLTRISSTQLRRNEPTTNRAIATASASVGN